MIAALKSPFLRRFLTGFSLGAIGMIALHAEQVIAAPLF
jgi:hypothetical protein